MKKPEDSTRTLTLTDFLLARIAEDEAVAQDAHYDGQLWYSEEETVDRWPEICDCGCPVMFAANRKIEAEHIARHDPTRVLAECKAKRQIMEGMRATADIEGGGYENAVSEALRYLAAVYASHSDYNPEWAL